MDTGQILETLPSGRFSIDAIVTDRPGIYTLCVKKNVELCRFRVRTGELLYIGKSTNLTQRHFATHFNSKGTGFSTVRRTLGAILKDQLKLEAVPRGTGRCKSEILNEPSHAVAFRDSVSTCFDFSAFRGYGSVMGA